MNYNYLVRKMYLLSTHDTGFSFLTFDIEKEYKDLGAYFRFGWAAFVAHNKSIDFMEQLCPLLTHGYMEDD